MSNQKKLDKNKGGINPVVAAVTGAVVGAGIAVAGAVALKDEKNRNKVKKAFSDVKDQAAGDIEDIQNKAEDKKDEAEKKLDEGKEALKKKSTKTSA